MADDKPDTDPRALMDAAGRRYWTDAPFHAEVHTAVQVAEQGQPADEFDRWHRDSLIAGASVALHLRARVVEGTDGPDQGDPAAAWDEGFEAGTEHTVALSAPPGPCGPVDPPRNPYVRAPGAVAAAPPGDEEIEGWADGLAMAVDDLRALMDEDYPEPERECAVENTRTRLDAGWRLVPPAAPAGHEDEAAVERADAPLALLLADIERHIARQEDRANRHLLRRVRAALAAARGPRTPDPTKENR